MSSIIRNVNVAIKLHNHYFSRRKGNKNFPSHLKVDCQFGFRERNPLSLFTMSSVDLVSRFANIQRAALPEYAKSNILLFGWKQHQPPMPR